jgi:hypothetical protein
MSVTIESVNAQAALMQLRSDLGLGAVPSEQVLPMELVAAVMRRLCATMCPCAARFIAATTKRSLGFFADDETWLDSVVQSVLEDLMTCGDVIELAHVTVQGAEGKPTWLFPSPPSCVARGDRLYLYGLAPDDAPFLPEELRNQVQYEGASRYLDLAGRKTELLSMVRALGLGQTDAKAWLSDTAAQPARAHLDQWSDRLRRDGVTGTMPSMKVLRHRSETRVGYQARWHEPTDETGLHVVRAERPHGAPLWYLAELRNGQALRSLLLPLPEIKARACDVAWRAQLAIDADRGRPAGFATTRDGDGVRLTFDFPLPLEARRRLLFVGGRNDAAANPYVFWIPASQADNEYDYLARHLWMVRPDS